MATGNRDQSFDFAEKKGGHKMNVKHWLVLSVSFLLLISAQMVGAEKIKIGAVGPLTGPAATLGISMKQALQIVGADVNDGGGIVIDGKKRQFEFIFADSQSRPEVGVSAVQKLLTRDKVDIIFHSLIHSSVALAAMELAPSYPNILFMTGQNVSIEIAKKIKKYPKKYGNVWKMGFNSDAYAHTVYGVMMELVRDGKISPRNKTLAFISEDTDYSKSNVNFTIPLFEKAGWKVTANEYVSLGHADFYPQIAKLRANEPDVLVSIFTSANSGIALVKQLKEQGIKSAHIGIPYPNYSEFMTLVSKSDFAEGHLSTPLMFDPINNPEHKAFVDRLSKYLDVKITQDHALGVCDAQLLFYNLERAGSLDIKALTKAFETTDFKCLLGRWVFDKESHSPLVGADYLAVPASQIQKGVHHAIWPKSIATSEYKAR
jgi:ABC-type branched-subunit amino acid transport system substrate-binding protein